jgi:hypothetical protein
MERRPTRPAIVCGECGRPSSDEEARGWCAYLTDDEPPEVALFCHDCARAEFDDE